MPERGKAAQPWARGTVGLRSDGRYEGREPSEKIPPAEKSRSVYSRTECKEIRKLRELRREWEDGYKVDAEPRPAQVYRYLASPQLVGIPVHERCDRAKRPRCHVEVAIPSDAARR